MSESPAPDSLLRDTQTRWNAYRLFIAASCMLMAVRILVVPGPSENNPFFSANDRSRWCTIRALGDQETYVIDSIVLSEDGRRFDPDWNTIDKVMHKGPEGDEHFYSSKPTLLPTLLSVEYSAIKWVTGWNLEDDTFKVARLMLILSNVLPMGLYLWVLALLVERFSCSNWTRLVVVCCGCFGTFLTTYAVTLNNHLPASISVLVSTYCLMLAGKEKRDSWPLFIIAGASAGFAAANELPALSFLGLAGLSALILHPVRCLLGFTPAVAAVAIGFFGTNYVAHATVVPPYAHRSDGELIATIDSDLGRSLADRRIADELWETFAAERRKIGFELSEQSTVTAAPAPKDAPKNRRWEIFDPDGLDRLAIVEVAPGKSYELLAWDNWYEYETSYWTSDKRSLIDQGEPSQGKYVFHMLIGHHGIFSLTPIWLLAVAGWCYGAVASRGPVQVVSLGSLLLFAVCFGFYATLDQGDRNYGGQTSGLRWMFWFIPLFLIGLIPICDRLARSTPFRWLAELSLAAGVLSVHYSMLNPWVHPWIYQCFGPWSESP